MIKRIKKLYLGQYADIRDYEFDMALKRKEDITFYYKDQTMIVPYKEIKKRGKKLTGTLFPSEFGKPYKLVSFKWKREPDLNNPQDFSKLVLS